MDIQDNSIIHTIKAYAEKHFGKKLEDEHISDDVRKLNFSDTLALITALKNNDDELVKNYIKVDVEEMQSPGAVSDKVSAATAREDGLNPEEVEDEDSVSEVAGARNMKATGRTSSKDPDDIQQNSNSEQASDNAQGVEDNKSEIEKLKRMAGIK